MTNEGDYTRRLRRPVVVPKTPTLEPLAAPNDFSGVPLPVAPESNGATMPFPSAEGPTLVPIGVPIATPEDCTLRVAQPPAAKENAHPAATQTQDELLRAIVGGDFQIDRLLGEGGMSRVYLARNRLLPDRRVAVKVLLREFAQRDDIVQRFVREGHAAIRIEHENVIRVHDAGQLPDGRPYLIMDFIENGVELHRYVGLHAPRGRGLAVHDWFPLAAQICGAVAAAHDAGVIHRDLKPDNILVLPTTQLTRSQKQRRRGAMYPRVVVLDFGIAWVADLRGITMQGTAAGTPGYMAPEQAKGDPVTAAADIYAIGANLFVLVTGTEPFSGETPLEVAMKQIEGPPDPRQWAPNLPQKVAHTIRRCLDPDPTLRPQSVGTLVAMLIDALPGARAILAELELEFEFEFDAPGGASPAGGTPKIDRSGRRLDARSHRWLWLLGGTLGIAAGGAILVSEFAFRGITPEVVGARAVIPASDEHPPAKAHTTVTADATIVPTATEPSSEPPPLGVTGSRDAPAWAADARPAPESPRRSLPTPAQPGPTTKMSTHRAAPVRVSGKGLLTVYATPYADVYLPNGTLVGTATFMKVEVPAGYLELVLRHPDYATKTKRVTVKPGRETQVTWSWETER